MDGAFYGDITLADLVALVINTVDVTCRCCGALWRSRYDYLPPSTSLQTMSALLICPSCGGREVSVTPACDAADETAH